MRRVVVLAAFFYTCSYAQTVPFAGNPIVVDSLSTTGTSFVLPGVLTGNSTVSLSVSGTPCLQNSAYCTNAAGVVLVPGTLGVGQSFSFTGVLGGVNNTWTVGALLMTISGVGTVQIFPTNSANGLSSATPPSSLAVSGATLSSLGFGNFAATNPSITFLFADNLYPDNEGSFSVSGSFGGVATSPASAPALSPAAMVSVALLLAAIAAILLRRKPGAAARG